MNDFDDYRTICWQVDGTTGFLVLNQPPGNIMNLTFFDEFEDWLDQVEKATPELIIISGASRHFSSGTDLDQLLSEVERSTLEEGTAGNCRIPAFISRNSKIFKRLSNLKIPVIAAISGVCIGSAFELALHCHFRISSKEGLFGLPETTFGLIPGLGGIAAMQRILKRAKAMEYLLRGKTFAASEALDLGLIDMIAERRDLRDVVLGFGRKLPENFKDFDRALLIHKIRKMSQSLENLRTITRYEQEAC